MLVKSASNARLLNDLHAVKVHPFVHARPSIAAVTVVELIRVVALVDVSRWLQGFLRHVAGQRGVVCFWLHRDETHGESRLHELVLLVSDVGLRWLALCDLPMRFPCWAMYVDFEEALLFVDVYGL